MRNGSQLVQNRIYKMRTARFHIILNNGQIIKQCTGYKYLCMKLTNNVDLIETIKYHTQKRKAISRLNSVFWYKNISKENKTRISDLGYR